MMRAINNIPKIIKCILTLYFIIQTISCNNKKIDYDYKEVTAGKDEKLFSDSKNRTFLSRIPDTKLDPTKACHDFTKFIDEYIESIFKKKEDKNNLYLDISFEVFEALAFWIYDINQKKLEFDSFSAQYKERHGIFAGSSQVSAIKQEYKELQKSFDSQYKKINDYLAEQFSDKKPQGTLTELKTKFITKLKSFFDIGSTKDMILELPDIQQDELKELATSKGVKQIIDFGKGNDFEKVKKEIKSQEISLLGRFVTGVKRLFTGESMSKAYFRAYYLYTTYLRIIRMEQALYGFLNIDEKQKEKAKEWIKKLKVTYDKQIDQLEPKKSDINIRGLEIPRFGREDLLTTITPQKVTFSAVEHSKGAFMMYAKNALKWTAIFGIILLILLAIIGSGPVGIAALVIGGLCWLIKIVHGIYMTKKRLEKAKKAKEDFAKDTEVLVSEMTNNEEEAIKLRAQLTKDRAERIKRYTKIANI